NTDGNFTECQAEIANIGDCEFNDPPGPQECMPDVGVGLSCEPAEVAQGSDLTCRIDVLNQSFGQAPNATMSTATPPGTTFVALTVPPAWICPELPAVGGTGAIECDPTLDPNSLHTFVLVLNVNPGTPEGTEITPGVTLDAH